MVILTIIIQFFTLIKGAIIASYFGVSLELDAFNLANRISTFVYSFIGAGVSTVIIPYLKDKVNKKGINIFISVIYSVGCILLVLMILFREEIIIFSGGTSNNYFITIASNILIFTALTGLINAIVQLVKGILEFNDKFNIQKLIILFSNIVLVVMLLFGNNNIYYYAFVVLFAAVLSLVFHVAFIRNTQFSFSLNYDFKNQNFKEMMVLFFPIMLSTSVYQISLLIDTLIAARLPVGSISILNYANTVISMINLLLLGNITSFVYPKLVKKSSHEEQQTGLVNYILLVNVLMCLLILLFYSSGKEGVSILFERGSFTSNDTYVVFIVALILAISLPTNAIRDLLYRYFYMNKDTFTPFTNSIIISVLNIIISLILSSLIGLYGVAIGTVLASFLSLFFISIRFGKKFEIIFNKKSFFVENGKIVLITIVSVVVLKLIKSIIIIDNTLIALLVYSILAVALFAFLLFVSKSKVFKLEL